MSLQHIGNYRIGKTLGVGSFGKVKLAEHERTGRKCAVKIHNRAKIRQQQLEEKVKREIKILKMCMHPHIIRLYEVIETPSDVYVFIEYSSGGELFDYIVERGRLTEDEARRFFQQLLVGVEYCHSNMIAHRDLKPENLLLDDKCNIKIADFGLSNCMRDGWFLKTSCGSPNYAAPEVISGKLYAGPEVDVWSCGVILYALLCGTLPFDDESIPFLFKKIKGGIYILPSYLSDQSKDLIGRMLVTDPLNRITTAEIRQHPWFRENLPAYLAIPPRVGRELFNVDELLVRNVAALMDYPPEKILKDIRKGRRNQFTAGYHLMKDANLRLDENNANAVPALTDTAHAAAQDAHLNGERRSKNESPDPGSGAHANATPVAMAISDAAMNMNMPVSMSMCTSPMELPVPEMTREWTAGIRLRQHNANEAMMELYRALNDLKWKWKTPVSHSFLIRALIDTRAEFDTPVRLALQLYKAPSGIGYMLDIQRIEGDVLAYFASCAELLRTLRV